MNLKIHQVIYTLGLCLCLPSCSLFSENEEPTLDTVVSMVKIDDDIMFTSKKNGLNTSNKNCLRDLMYLKKINSKYYKELQQNYNKLAYHSRFYDESVEVMNKDMKDAYAAKLAIKKDKLCILINNTVTKEIKTNIG
ncbi:hypothetical protein [Lelliottia nimipressuralis]|uniref:Lipoprotein n=1 Tax=Lelliottia nimipressuralis TaxID=69220 RepID=A0ABY3NXL5_9ENTR|nr:hypothetical protein [Lelliottia nimipressuralis]RXJ10766.1 hypothetical protein ETG88_19745 [Lelliottia nimipressuralis]TYT29267.1 hypothetical protein FZO59_21025 [Lelliottia nimipressuralis]